MNNSKLEEIIPRLTEECRRKVLVKLLVAETLTQKKKWQSPDETLKYEDIKPLSAAAEISDISPNQFRSCLRGESIPSDKTIANTLPYFSKREQADLILNDLLDGIYQLGEIFDEDALFLMEKSENNFELPHQQQNVSKNGDEIIFNLRFWKISLGEKSWSTDSSTIWEYLGAEDEEDFKESLKEDFQWPRLRNIFGDMLEEKTIKWFFILNELLQRPLEEIIMAPFFEEAKDSEIKKITSLVIKSETDSLVKLALKALEMTVEEGDFKELPPQEKINENFKEILEEVGELAIELKNGENIDLENSNGGGV